jgi:hypothetical protein
VRPAVLDDLRRLLCYLIGHDAGETLQDGKGAAWHRCKRCGTVTHAHSWHGGRPWEKDS